VLSLKFVPIFMGSAFKNRGVQLLLDGVHGAPRAAAKKPLLPLCGCSYLCAIPSYDAFCGWCCSVLRNKRVHRLLNLLIAIWLSGILYAFFWASHIADCTAPCLTCCADYLPSPLDVNNFALDLGKAEEKTLLPCSRCAFGAVCCCPGWCLVAMPGLWQPVS
jgi:hypothetical protein